MRKRDLAILMLSGFAIFFTLQHEGDFAFKEAWFHLYDDYPVKHESDRLPPPLIADLNGDGKKEVLVATNDAKIQVLEPHSRRVDEGFSEARVLAEISLLPDKIRVASGRRAVAMATGVIDRYYKDGTPQKQVLVVVTSGWSVLCFDHNLKKLWETNLQEDFPHSAHHREIAISISNYTLKHGDTGLVIVGGRMEMQPYNHMDPFEELGMMEKNAEEHRRSATEKQPTEDSGGVNLRHFSVYAFAGRTGVLRWSKKTDDVEAHTSDASQLVPQHNYKLDVHSINSRHPGEFECREFRESILSVMPHHWDRREDTLLKLAHFRRHKRKTLKKQAGKSATFPFHKPEEHTPAGKDLSRKIPKFIGKAARYAGSAKTKKGMQYIPTITNYTKLWWVPNVVVAHQKEGIEAIHLPTGRTLCKLHLLEGGLHADINGDGVLDHVQAVGGNVGERTVVSGSMEVLKPCWAVATSGVPVREQLFNVSICHHAPFNFMHYGEFSRNFAQARDTSSLEIATPILIPRDDGHKHRRSHGDVIFLTNRGEVTSYTPDVHGREPLWQWQLQTEATWSNLPSPSGLTESGSVVPTLKPFSLRVHDNQPMVLAGGDQAAVIISPGGSVLASIELPSQPTHALITDDFSNDGLTDVIVMTSNGIYGFVQTRQPGALFFSSLVGCILVVMAVIFVTQHLNSVKVTRPTPLRPPSQPFLHLFLSSFTDISSKPLFRPQEMESVELPLTNMETAVGEDFSVDDLLDFSNDDVFVEDGAELKEVSVSSNDETTLIRSNDFSTACELAVPTDDLAELEWLSNFVDDSSFTTYSAPTNKPVLSTGNRRQHPLTPVNAESCFKPPLPVKIRTKRPRTGVSLLSPSLTDSSSSCGHSSPLCLSGAEFLDEKAVKRQKKRKPLSSLEVQTQTQTRRCSHCGVQKTPQWRAGPAGAKTLCNACGVRFKSGRLLPEYRPACSPTFSSELHSNHHREVVEMRQKKEMSGDAGEPGMNRTVQAVQSF
ncbi:FG-GAP repeat-containing protein [Hirschfeldia incana]|nr:FG-GAP repeat-containing protein [Hirschfeldia incana]